MRTKKPPTISIQVNVTPQAKAKINSLVRHSQIPQKRAMSRIFEWFSRLPETAQKAVLWPPTTIDEVDATAIALDFLRHRRAEVEAANKAAQAALDDGTQSG